MAQRRSQLESQLCKTSSTKKNKSKRVNLQQLYMAAGENDSESGSSSMGSAPGGSLSLAEPVACAGSSAPLLCSDAAPRDCQQSEQLCVVCHYFPLSRALLPCRHTCICAICFCKYNFVHIIFIY